MEIYFGKARKDERALCWKPKLGGVAISPLLPTIYDIILNHRLVAGIK